MKVFVKLLTSDLLKDSRNKRELSVVKTFDVDIHVVAKGDAPSVSVEEGYMTHRLGTRPLGNLRLLRGVNQVLSLFTWARRVRKLKPNYISCHDLIALFIGWMSTWLIRPSKRALLIYDSHEFEIGRNTGGERNWFVRFVILRLEKFLMKRAAFSMMVNDSIADEVMRIHQLKERPVVVRNTPENWGIDEEVIKKRKQAFRSQLGIDAHGFILMYHGFVVENRGIEALIRLIAQDETLALVILGNGEADYIEDLKALVVSLGAQSRVLFHEAVDIDVLWEYVGAADAGMVTIPAVSRSYYYMLPNKFFENIQSLTPIIGSDFPEVSRIIHHYGIGLTVDPLDLDAMVEAVHKMRTDHVSYQRYKLNLVRAKHDLCWENEKRVLEEAYRKIMR